MMNEKLQSVAMSSENGFKKSQVSASSNIRKKIDVLNRHENRDSKEQVLRDSKCNLRMSLAWDSAFFTSPGVLEPEELFTALNSRNYDNVVNILGNEEHLLLSSQSLEPDTNSKAENYNYRNSLAWDNGFFTSEGVLNPSELAIVNDGLKKSESHLVPVIEDEVWRSMESNTTFDSEGSSLTRLEMDLFEDIRASIPKPISSRFEPERPASAEPGGSRTMMKAKANCRKQSIINKHGSKKIIKDIPKSPKVQLKHLCESREHHPSSSPKPFKALEQISKSSTKMASLGEKHVKLGCRSVASASAEGLGKLKKPCFRQSLNSIHSSIQSLRSSLSRYTTSKATRRPPSEITIRKSPPNFRRKVNSQGSNILVASSSSVTPLMKKTKASKTAVESSFQSTPTSSWHGSPSPASSIDEWPLEFSSTSATQRCNRSKRSSYSSLRSSLTENDNQESVVNQRHRKDHKKEGNADTSRILREVKPSGLRMPSPKHGFFDAENMLELATIADAKRDVVAHRTRYTNLQSPRTRLGAEVRIRKSGGTPVSISATKGKRSPTVKIYKKTGQCNQSMKVEKKIISQYTELDENKENEFSFVEGLAKQVKSIGLNNSDTILRLSRQN